MGLKNGLTTKRICCLFVLELQGIVYDWQGVLLLEKDQRLPG